MSKMSKVHWNDVKLLIKQANVELYKLIEPKSPSEKLPLYLVEYSYGEIIGNKNEAFLPDERGILYQLGGKETPEEIMRDLGYGSNSLPLGVILQNNCEWFYQDELTKENFPFAIQGPGTIFNQQIIFNESESIENNTVSVSSGAKSLFMLPYIGCQTHHERLKNTYGLSLPAPKSTAEHFDLFKEILSCSAQRNCWVSTVIYFSEKWIDQIRNNNDWLPIKYFFSERLRKKYSSNLYNSFYNDLFSTAEGINRFRPTPYLIDTAKYIFSILMGQGIGYKPAIDTTLLPLELIQESYTKYYQLPYTPTVMVPANLSESIGRVYFSLQQPSVKINTFKISMNNSTYRELLALKDIISSYKRSFTSTTSACYGSALQKACEDVKLEFYHHKPTDANQGILSSKTIVTSDTDYQFSFDQSREFSADAKFFRGCIKISR